MGQVRIETAFSPKAEHHLWVQKAETKTVGNALRYLKVLCEEQRVPRCEKSQRQRKCWVIISIVCPLRTSCSSFFLHSPSIRDYAIKVRQVPRNVWKWATWTLRTQHGSKRLFVCPTLFSLSISLSLLYSHCVSFSVIVPLRCACHHFSSLLCFLVICHRWSSFLRRNLFATHLGLPSVPLIPSFPTLWALCPVPNFCLFVPLFFPVSLWCILLKLLQLVMEKVSKHATALGVSQMVNTDQCWGYYYIYMVVQLDICILSLLEALGTQWKHMKFAEKEYIRYSVIIIFIFTHYTRVVW